MAVAADTPGNSSTEGATSLTFAYTCAGANRLLCVGVAIYNGNGTEVTGVTYNGVAMTSAGSVLGSAADEVTIWYLVAPATGSNNVVVSFDNAVSGAVAGAINFTNVHQTTPTGSFVSATGTSTAPSVNASSESGGMVLDVLGVAPSKTATVGAGQTERWNVATSGNVERGCGSTEPGAASVTMSWSLNASDAWAIGALPIKAAAEATRSLALLGVS